MLLGRLQWDFTYTIAIKPSVSAYQPCFRWNCSLRDKLKNENFLHNPEKLELYFQENSKFGRKPFFENKWIKWVKYNKIKNDIKIIWLKCIVVILFSLFSLLNRLFLHCFVSSSQNLTLTPTLTLTIILTLTLIITRTHSINSK